MRSPEIRLVNHGVANHFGNYIEINSELMEYPELYDYVLKHEINHTSKSFSLEDLKNEFKVNYGMVFKLFKFVLVRPRLWYEFLPIYRRKKVWNIDFVLIALYLISFSTIAALFILASAIL